MQALKLDYDIHIDHKTIVQRIWKEINERIIFYVHFICGERNKLDDVLKDACKFINRATKSLINNEGKISTFDKKHGERRSDQNSLHTIL